ncbi:hypothetical protein [Maricaulis sp.]|uniref:hypothetical protein n=1 Tax=Maricaulis sp. TaxID=1486257 RepID=UPI003A95AC2A
MLVRLAWKWALAVAYLILGIAAFPAAIIIWNEGWPESREKLADAALFLGLMALALWALGMVGGVVYKVLDMLETRRINAIDRTIGDESRPIMRPFRE